MNEITCNISPRIQVGRRFTTLLSIAFAIFVSGCGTMYPSVSSDCYDLAKSLTTVCNLRKTDQLAQLRQLASDREQAGKISRSEREILESIVEEAESGDWEQAEDSARKLLAAQQKAIELR